MPDRALAAAFGGLGEFMKLRRGYNQETEDREQKKQAFESGMERDRVVTEGGRLSNQEAERRIARQPTIDQDADFDAAIRRMGGAHNLTDQHYALWAGNDPTRQAQIPAMRKYAAESAARIKVQDQRDANAGKLVDLQTQGAQLELPGKQADAKNREQATQWVLEHPEAKPLEDDYAARMYAMAGIPVAPSYARTRRDQLALAGANRPNPMDYVRAQGAYADEQLAETLPPNVSTRAAKVYSALEGGFVANIKNSLQTILKTNLDITKPAEGGLVQQRGQGDSYAEQQAKIEAWRLAKALHMEADDIKWQMQKNGATREEIEWAAQQMRHHLTQVPKFDWTKPPTGAGVNRPGAGLTKPGG